MHLNPTQFRRVAKRAATTRTVLDYCAIAGVLVGCYFWASLFIDLYQPATLLRWGMILSISFLFSLALPALLSILVPTTPASQFLQKTRWGTVGFWVTVAGAIFLFYVAWQLTWSWQAAQPNVAQAGYTYHMTLVWIILLALVPGVALVQMPTERLVKEFQQAQAVRRLELSYKHDLLLAKEAYGRALAILRTGLDRATLEQRQYVAGVFQAIHTAESNNLRIIGGMLYDYGDGETLVGSENDDLAEQLVLIGDAIMETADQTERNMAQSLKQAQADIDNMSTSSTAVIHRTTERPSEPATKQRTVITPAHSPNTAAQSQSERPLNDRTSEPVNHSGPQRSSEPVSTERSLNDEPYQLARRELRGLWESKDLQRELNIGRTMANTYIKRWREAGVLNISTEKRNHYYWNN